ncbi:hypothetical protein JHD50_10535 [Sulfurimonas sp. MAG313]|nr:LPS assembly lipoprotein LptE [Sulfurimonas sp. MAG313]MDF1881730.1 hypothetical protein [Sulfurimonas sp. MAG313]
MQRLFNIFLVFIFITGCGYLPASKQARKVVGASLYVEVVVPLDDPENAVIIKDATRQAVVTRFHSALVSASKAKTTLLVKLSNISFVPLQYDKNGYIAVYRAIISLNITRKRGNSKKIYRSKGIFDFTIEPNAVITDNQRFNAITQASLKALDSFVAQVGAEGSTL